MPTEIERKFLVTGTEWHEVYSVHIIQGYLCCDKGRTVRVRLAGEKAFLTLKGIKKGISRPEFEYEIPVADAEQMLELCNGATIEKMRHIINYKDLKWEVDEFLGENQGLIVAEIELEEENQQFERPGWLGQEVTGDPRYANAYLASNPYSTWHYRETNESKLKSLLEYVKADGRIYPKPKEWAVLWEMLPDKKRIGPSWEPPMPLMLSARRSTPLLARTMLLEEHIRYAAEHGRLDDIDTYLRGLKPEQWFPG
jgi:CYTH domain-containing protein